MNLEKRFLEIRDFLCAHQNLHELEVLERFPEGLGEPYATWAQEILDLNQKELILLENELDESFIKTDSYCCFLKEIKKLTKVEKFKLDNDPEPIPQNLKRKLSQKKIHEIQIIRDQIGDAQKKHFIDIGSGAGHLSTILLHKNSNTSHCLDLESSYQDIGIKKLTREAPEILERIKFTPVNFMEKTPLIKQGHTTLLGLHSCGDLSVNIIKSFKHNELDELLNYGCCYHKLTEDSLHLSSLAKEASPNLTNHSLTMAAKSFKTIDDKSNQTRLKVKSFRYSLHFLLHQHFQMEFKTFGNARKDDYNGTFSAYVFKFFPEARERFSNSELDVFFNSNENQQRIKLYLALGVIRSHLSRLIELYIILDRAIFLKEAGYIVEVKETFNRKLSPRNLSIQSWKNT